MSEKLRALYAGAVWLEDKLARVLTYGRQQTPFITTYLLITPPPIGGRGIVFGRFFSFFLCQQHYEKTAGPICMKFSEKLWSDHGTT